jgi:hypothetical protein
MIASRRPVALRVHGAALHGELVGLGLRAVHVEVQAERFEPGFSPPAEELDVTGDLLVIASFP